MRTDIEMVHIGDEAGGAAHDIESLHPLPRGLSWAKSWKIRSQRVGTGLSAASISSAISHWSFQWVARWSPSTKRVVEEINSPEPLTQAYDHFLTALLGQQPRDKTKEAFKWYTNFLEFKIREAWPTLFFRVLAASSNPPGDDDLSIAFKVLQTIVEQLGRENLALTDIVDKLYNTGLLKFTDHKRSHANQLALACVGWISTLYSANSNPDPEQLQITNSANFLSSSALEAPQRASLTHRGRSSKSKKTYINYSQTLDNNDQPLHIFLRGFGTVIPQRQTPYLSGHSSPLPHTHTKHGDDWIEASLLSFHTLNKIAKVKIEWVDSLSQHLEFDTSSKVLKIYRLPSLCLLMCCCEKEAPLSRLFSDAAETNRYLSVELEDAYDFYQEVLLSYRLIFGQDLTSSSDLLDHLKISPLPLLYNDPLLLALCGSNWENNEKAKQVYESIGADDPSPLLPSTQFPFLGQRVLDLQDYVKRHKPNDFRSLWHDKRDSLGWWTFWAVLILSGITLLLTVVFGFLQTILGGYQVYYAREQFLQQQMPHG